MARLRAHARLQYKIGGGTEVITLEADSTPQVEGMVVNALADLRQDNARIEKVTLTDTRGDQYVYHYSETPEGVVTHLEKNGVRHI